MHLGTYIYEYLYLLRLQNLKKYSLHNLQKYVDSRY